MRLSPIDNSFVVNAFDCGKLPLDKFLKSKAARSAARREHSVFVASLGSSKRCLGYFALQIGSDAVPDTLNIKKSYLKTYSAFPAVHLSYLAVDVQFHKQGLGRFLLMEVFSRVAEISKHAGFYALTLQSIDEDSTNFYRSLGFEDYVSGPQPKLLYPLANILKTVSLDET